MSALPRPLPILTLLAATGPACAPEAAAGPSEVTPAVWERPVAERAVHPFPRRFVNQVGEAYVIERPPQRIASSTLFTDVVLLACCPKDRIAALHEVSKNPSFSPIAAASKDAKRTSSGFRAI